tara:strand:+ start:1168 stop:3813 length:2646 start_codon:yes stop_codon:yes gene_type:complete
MTIIDKDSDGTPDGMINLYDEYFNVSGDNIEQGTWFDPNFDFVLDPNTGDLNLWDLTESSLQTNTYTYILSNASCGNVPALTLNLILGPFSGDALPPIGTNTVNVQVCNTGNICIPLEGFDLFKGLQSDPSPHLNGAWIYEGSSPNFINIDGSDLYVEIPYQAGPPLIDEETFDLVYVVPGISPCVPEQRTTVSVSVIRQASSGESKLTRICEEDLINGFYDLDIDLTNDSYLLNEDLEGVWSGDGDAGGQITTPADHFVNMKSFYDDLMAVNPRFGFKKFNFRFDVDQRSAVCSDLGSDIPFVIFEMLRPFSQAQDRVICLDDDAPATINLFDELEFTTENGVLYEYKKNGCTNWELVSGPSDLDIKSHSSGVCTFDAVYTPDGTINLTNAESGVYIFRYTVNPHINCATDCSSFEYESRGCAANFSSPNHTCAEETALVTLVLTQKLYAGENTMNIELCEDENPIDLISLLETVDQEIVYSGEFGEWTDENNNVIANSFVVPAITDQHTYNFTYTTTSNGTCIDIATLSFTVFEQYKAGDGLAASYCSDTLPINLYDVLTGEKGDQGSWSGPNGYSASYLGSFDPSIQVSGDYIYSVPANGPCLGQATVLSITVDEKPNAGEDLNSFVCVSDGEINLFELLAPNADRDGEFINNATSQIITNGLLNLASLSVTDVAITYTVNRNDSCTLDSAIITLAIITVAPPTVAQEVQTFCILEGATISDLQVVTAIDYAWYDSVDSSNPLSIDDLLQNRIYYVSNFNDAGCESLRQSVAVVVLNVGDSNDCKPDMQDGVSPNNDGMNDVLDITDLAKAFPNFELSIYNRYGTKVYSGISSTPYFSGITNIRPHLGDDLPSGVYFFVFEPQDGVNKPFQDSFYLSK